jgi:hypothetical protein
MTDRHLLTTDQIDAVIRRVDVLSAPDPGFIASSYAALEGRARAARVRDATWFGRLRRDIRVTFAPALRPAVSRSMSLAALVMLLMLALIAGLIVAGALRQPSPLGNGLLIASVKGQLEAIDPASGSARPILPSGVKAEGVSRSPDGRIATFWTNDAARSHLFAIGVDGRDRLELATGLSVVWNRSIDTWSSDSRFLASEVTDEGVARILIVNVATGEARPVTPPSVVAHNPLWSPDGQWIAFTPETTNRRGLSVIRTDGTDLHDVAGNLHGLDVSGPDTWSPDGEWIYFNAGNTDESHVFRASVTRRFSQQLSSDDLKAYATASSPDGSRIAFIVDAPYGFDLWIANSDGRGSHRILAAAGLGGWSSDGEYILVNWKPPDETMGGLGTVRPDGTDLKILIPYDSSCRQGWDETCALGFGWGQARP